MHYCQCWLFNGWWSEKTPPKDQVYDEVHPIKSNGNIYMLCKDCMGPKMPLFVEK